MSDPEATVLEQIATKTRKAFEAGLLASEDRTSSMHGSFWLSAYIRHMQQHSKGSSENDAACPYSDVALQYPKYVVKLLLGTDHLDSLPIFARLFKETGITSKRLNPETKNQNSWQKVWTSNIA